MQDIVSKNIMPRPNVNLVQLMRVMMGTLMLPSLHRGWAQVNLQIHAVQESL